VTLLLHIVERKSTDTYKVVEIDVWVDPVRNIYGFDLYTSNCKAQEARTNKQRLG